MTHHVWDTPKGRASFAEMKRLREAKQPFRFHEFESAWQSGRWCRACGVPVGESSQDCEAHPAPAVT